MAGESSASPRGNGPDGCEQLLGRVVLEHEAAGAGAERLVDVLVEVEGRQDQDPRGVIGGNDPPRRLEPVELGHADVHQHDRGPEAGGLLDRFQSVARLGDDLDVLLAGEQHAEAGADHRLVVDDEHADRHQSSPPSGRRVLRMKPLPFTVPALISPP